LEIAVKILYGFSEINEKINGKNLIFIIVITISFFLSSCHIPVNCDDAEKSYKYWAGEDPPADLKTIHGQYKQSLHFTLEYWLYLEIKPTRRWRDEMIHQNNFIADTAGWSPSSDVLTWFKPARHCKKRKAADKFQDSCMLQDSLTGHCYIYISQFNRPDQHGEKLKICYASMEK
jgi:hypothetical protein